LEREFERDDERVVDQRQHGSLGKDMGDLTRSTGYVSFADRLECIDTLGILLANLHDLSKGTLPDHFEQVERVDR